MTPILLYCASPFLPKFRFCTGNYNFFLVLSSIPFNKNTAVSFSTCRCGLLPAPSYYEQCYSGTSPPLFWFPLMGPSPKDCLRAMKWPLQRAGASSVSLSHVKLLFQKWLCLQHRRVSFVACPQEHLVLSDFHFSQFAGWQVCCAFILRFLIIVIKPISICSLVLSFLFCKIPLRVMYFLLSFLLIHSTALYMNSISVYLWICWCIYLSKTIVSGAPGWLSP